MVQWSGQESFGIPHPIQVSPRGFKSNLKTIVDALIQRRLSTTVLAKLPQGSSWVDDLKRYSQAVTPSPAIYLLSRRPPAAANWFIPALIPSLYPMQGHYSLTIVSEAVGIVVVADREPVSALSDDSTSEAEDQSTEDFDSLKVYLSITVHPALIQHQLDELHRVFQTSLTEHPHQTQVRSLISNWHTLLPAPEQFDPTLMDAILMQLGAHQARLRYQARRYRRQAMTASSLSTQNETLLNTLRLKDDFLNTVGQELRTPLSTIKTALPLLSSPSLKPAQRQRYLDMISRECDRQRNLINGVLDLLQLEQSLSTATPDQVRLSDVVPAMVSTYQPIAQEKGIRLAYTVPDTLPPVCCPESWVRQIVIHLLNNGIRYTDVGGEVWVTVQEQDSDDDSLLLNVKDTGVGIAANELPHIFDHFYRGRQPNQEEEGAGLGLTIVQQLLLHCGGSINVESQPNLGTHFKVRLPLCR